jgi:NAD(P)-dependent dehydrogenase (short-subunit alcohol dehydrogenase family)
MNSFSTVTCAYEEDRIEELSSTKARADRICKEDTTAIELSVVAIRNTHLFSNDSIESTAGLESRARQFGYGAIKKGDAMKVNGRVADKIALVTGAASGIGRATASLLASEGAKVVVTDVADKMAQEVTEQIGRDGGKAVFIPLDVSDESAWQNVIDRILHDFAGLDIAVNNAGIASSRPITEMTLAEWRRVMQVNLDGVFLGTKYAIQLMKAGKGGSIINVASASGIKASAGASAYCASKAAVRLFSKTVALECLAAGLKIRVNIVSPGGVRTPIWEKMDFWPGLVAEHGSEEAAWKALAGSSSDGFFSPDDIASAILFLAADESSYMNATELVIDRGYTA